NDGVFFPSVGLFGALPRNLFMLSIGASLSVTGDPSNVCRLSSERGLPALCNLFDNVNFKGKGHEEADLKTLIRHMEHWAHRLFPQLPFEKVVERIESLGNKKPVQACLKRIRLDLPLSNEDFRSHEG
ncbi:hypothetical protein E2320_013589, partial [Naja naja]